MDFKRAGPLNFGPAQPAMGYKSAQLVGTNYLVLEQPKDANLTVLNLI